MANGIGENEAAIRARFRNMLEKSRQKAGIEPMPPQGAGEDSRLREEPANDPTPPRRRGPQKKPTKVQISIRLDRDVLDAMRSRGRGWQTRLNDMLRETYLSAPPEDQAGDPKKDDRANHRDDEG